MCVCVCVCVCKYIHKKWNIYLQYPGPVSFAVPPVAAVSAAILRALVHTTPMGFILEPIGKICMYIKSIQ